MIDIKGTLGDLASGSIKDERIALLQEQLADALAKLKVTEAKLADTEAKLAASEADNARLKLHIADLEAQLQHQKLPGPPGDVCPYCKQETGRLDEIRPFPELLARKMGVKQHHYTCQNPGCGKTYDKRVNPTG
jgi:DNA repair exonuclease SbcCD ATPase subunit